MATDAAPLSAAGHDAAAPVAHAWQGGLLWLGAPLCLAVLASTGIAARWHGGRFAEPIVLAPISVAIAALVRWVLRWRIVRDLAVAWPSGLVFSVGDAASARTLGGLEWWRIPAKGAR